MLRCLAATTQISQQRGMQPRQLSGTRFVSSTQIMHPVGHDHSVRRRRMAMMVLTTGGSSATIIASPRSPRSPWRALRTRPLRRDQASAKGRLSTEAPLTFGANATPWCCTPIREPPTLDCGGAIKIDADVRDYLVPSLSLAGGHEIANSPQADPLRSP